ncbi:beta-1,4-galactosyltransferase 1 isoform X2 [Bradysia coprophila]|uniref:beta-1,4-galactosyltransferase 1 isoform X2 n=1 Tax=Bradysia coprophila TaxID=38358 RepID=UPI00187D9800|nr:beta-1,4-galactosyltransferase 1 isoform X2 [Bradysia coprophila]
MKVLFKFLPQFCDFVQKYCIQIGCTLLVLYCLWPTRFASHYEYLTSDQIFDNLVQRTTRNVTLSQQMECDYSDIIMDNTYMYKTSYQSEIFDSSEIQLGGVYQPERCKPLFSTAIIVPYRQREKQLQAFLIYMHNYLRKQNINYRIFVVEQFDAKPFNRAKLFNIGSVYATRYDYPCFIFHDVDLMPMRLGHIYACSKQPRHMCSALDKFRFHLPYTGLFGGAVAVQNTDFVKINGMSNMFQGWGGEDDDLYGRLKAKEIDICRFAPEYSEYTMLQHAPETPNKDRLAFLRDGHLRFHSDGLNSLTFKEKDFKLHKLFTHVLVET